MAFNPARFTGFVFSLIGKYGPGIVDDVKGLVEAFRGHPAADAVAPAAVAVATDLHASKASGSPVSLASIGETADKRGLELNYAQAKELHSEVNK